jgi:F420-dependent oxidoreductase-like protein
MSTEGMNMARLSFGVKTAQQHSTYPAMLDVWKEADTTPIFEHAWLFDHFAPIQGDLDGPCVDGWTLLAALAAETERIRLGLMVTGNTYRHPAVLAKIATTVDVVSDGRLDFGVGAGWNEYEHHSMGIPLYPPGQRLRRFEEACEIWKRLFTQHLTDFDGRYYQLKEARNEPKPVQQPHPPFVIGGSGEQITLRVVAKYADVWNFNGRDVDTFNHKLNVLRQHCADVGRDIDEIQLSIQSAVDYDNLDNTIHQVQSFVDAGVTHIILNLRPPYPDGIVTRLAEEVVPKIQS